MAVPETDKTNISSANPSSIPISPSARPSWETAQSRPPAPAPRPPAPRPPLQPPLSSVSPSASTASAAAPAPTFSSAPDTNVQYDLAGNPIPGSGQALPSGQIVYSSGTTAGSWPPAPTSPYGYGVAENGTDRVARLKWNWGAFLIPFWWSVFNGQKGIAIAIFLLNGLDRVIPAPYDWGVLAGSLGVQIYLGFMGHRLAWSSDRFGEDYDNFISTQRSWMIWGIVLAVLIAVVLVTASVLLPGFLSGLSGTPHAANYGTSNNATP